MLPHAHHRHSNRKALLRIFARWGFVALGLLLAGAVYAQPWQPQVIWQREGQGDSSLYGEQILALGDQNNDGFADWAVYAFGWGPPGQVCEPKVEFFHGGNPPSTTPYMVRTTQTPEEAYLYGARALGDANGDGYVDWAVMVELANDPTYRTRYKLYFGGPGAHTQPDLVLTAPSWMSSYRGIGDFNGDGFDDLIQLDGVNYCARILFGGSPMDTLPDWTRHADVAGATAGHLNGDRYADFISYETDAFKIYLGGQNPDTLPAYQWPLLASERQVVQDLNGDGYDDFCIAQTEYARVCWGGTVLDTTQDARLDFPCTGAGPDWIRSAGDINHDGYGDVLMISRWCDNAWFGVLTLHLSGVAPRHQPVWTVIGWTDPLNLIGMKCAAGLGDVNGDGVDDFAIGSNDDGAYLGWRGKAVVLAGESTLPVTDPPHAVLPEQLALSVYPNPFNAVATISLVVPHAGEVSVKVFDLTGRLVKILCDERREAGEQAVGFEGKGLSSWVYLVRVQVGTESRAVKVMLLK